MQSIDRIKRTFRGESIDRVGIVDYYWGLTVERWRQQGLGDAEPDYYFDHDIIYFHLDPRFGFEERFIGEDADYKVIYTTDGETLKIPKDPESIISRSDVLGVPVDYTIKGREDWEKHKHLYQAGEWRLHSNPPLSGSWFGYPDLEHYRQRYRKAVEHGKFKCLVFREPYECIREIMGTDRMLELMALDPQLIREMLRHNLDITFQMLDLLEQPGPRYGRLLGVGRHRLQQGPVLLPRDVPRPAPAAAPGAAGPPGGLRDLPHRRPADRLPAAAAGGRHQGHQSHGDQSGQRLLRHRGPLRQRIVITGGIDARVMSTNDKAAIEEIRRKLLHAKRRKYIYHSDHSIPYDVTLDTYRFVIQKVKQYGACRET